MKVNTGITLDKEVMEFLKKESKRERRSFSNYVNGIIIDHKNKVE